ncbi:hypothetical protein [Sinanaerobacter sp. ZZT-01]|nr:hypothetical protein [Sinanaerobacter sp. ZZT-01]WRR94226.1 hypothetical protein U5921_03655 [Sinanaerobacter sp. ZZT-01]
MAKDTTIICKSIFKSGSNKTLKTEFTGKWIELINQMEKNKASAAGTR